MKLNYQAFNRDGERVSGIITAASEREAQRLLEEQGVSPIEFAPARQQESRSRRRLRTREVVQALDEFCTLLESDVGIAESHALDMCGGMAKAGLKPFAVIYSTFMQRAFDQVFQESALQGLPVRICMDRAGLVGGDGAVHHGFADIAFLSVFPKIALTAAMDEKTLRLAMDFMLRYEQGPSAVRYPRDNVPTHGLNDQAPPFELGKAHRLVEGNDLAILAYGFPANHALEAQSELAAQGYSVAVYDARFAKPVDLALVRQLIESNTPIVTVEDHGLSGGFGAQVLAACSEAGLPTHKITRLGLPDDWIYQGSRSGQLAEAGIDAAAIARTVRKVLDDRETADEPAGRSEADRNDSSDMLRR